ncbi:MAG: two-component sensor histidine kinase [Prevotellaceae bacterium]|jgi:signal transduction histidine kinase|nr:two-component sensor histidine kinase [Prevotellaceae bacterium]
MKLSYKQRLTVSFCIILAGFTAGIAAFEHYRERAYKTEALKEKLDAYCQMAETSLQSAVGSLQFLGGSFQSAVGNNTDSGASPLPTANYKLPTGSGDSLLPTANCLLLLLPPSIRFTWIDAQGEVLYDNLLSPGTPLENHAGRPEIVQAAKEGKGSDIRISSSNNREYLYYAKRLESSKQSAVGSGQSAVGDNTDSGASLLPTENCPLPTVSYIRMALPYDIHVRHFLKPGNGFLYFILALFGVGLLFINYVAGRFGRSIRQLRDFSRAAGNDTLTLAAAGTHFPDDELGDIGTKIVHNYLQLKTQEKKIALEKEKLLQHVQHSAEGICFFTPDRKVAFYNPLFLQYLNILGEEITTDPAHILEEEFFNQFAVGSSSRQSAVCDNTDSGASLLPTENRPLPTGTISRQGKCFLMRVNRFDDNSFEVVLNDITPSEKTRRLKQELTGHIAHELRTPVTSIRGYLETILEQPLTPEKKQHFLQKAYRQTLMLSEMIRDMNLLTKLEEPSGTFALKPVSIAGVIKNVAGDMAALLEAQDITVETGLPQNAWVYGNENLLYAVFRNLMENVVHHAGKQVKILITQYAADRGFLHFSFADTGVGIADPRHLPRLFERFYRVTEGRTRDTGGTGLGLAIVKNIIVFHKGTITVKNRTGGGLQFLFSLPETPGMENVS